MVDSNDVERLTVLDSEGVRGTMTTHAYQQGDAQVLIDFDQGQQVQAPRDMLRLTENGNYVLLASLRALANKAPALQPGRDKSGREQSYENVVAVVPVVEEEAEITKREIETGRVRVHKNVEVVEEQVDLPLLHDEVQVEHVPVGRYLDEPASPEYRGDTYVIPVMEEVLVVHKRLLLREEIHVTTVREKTPHQERVTLRREKVTVTREQPETREQPDGSPANPAASETAPQ
jgi:uncharacterized protein (TIGR02271 family)